MPPDIIKQTEGALDHKRIALIRAIKSIIPPPYLLQAADVKVEHLSGRTGNTTLIENDRRSREYEATVERMYNYLNEAIATIGRELEARCEGEKEDFVAMMGEKERETVRRINSKINRTITLIRSVTGISPTR